MRELLFRLLRVPAEPQPPPGAPDSQRVFRAAPGFYHYRLLEWSTGQFFALVGLLVSFGFSFGIGAAVDVPFLRFFESVAIPIYIVQLMATFFLLRLNYELRWYMVSDRSLRIREGVFRIREQTMTVANIQNMQIRQGPVQKLFGIADLQVRTAGGGASSDSSREQRRRGDDPHLGSLRGLDNAVEVRDLIMAALRRRRDSGLGDPDEVVAPLPAPGASSAGREAEDTVALTPAIAAAGEVLRQARALHRQLATPVSE